MYSPPNMVTAWRKLQRLMAPIRMVEVGVYSVCNDNEMRLFSVWLSPPPLCGVFPDGLPGFGSFPFLYCFLTGWYSAVLTLLPV